jgi:hypothetical protein
MARQLFFRKWLKYRRESACLANFGKNYLSSAVKGCEDCGFFMGGKSQLHFSKNPNKLRRR